MNKQTKVAEPKKTPVTGGYGWIENIFSTPKESQSKYEKLKSAATTFAHDVFELIPEGEARMKVQRLFSETILAAKNGIVLGNVQYGNA